ncbi:hypothetical protein BKI52_12650 [marine bacterium AO1-C]|nr:hypothetical protein BKI52_12650 [marine bacterium AO1-C]
MKMNLKKPLLCVLLLLLFTIQSQAQKKYRLALKLTPNTSYLVEQDISQNVEQKIMGQDQTTYQVTRTTFEYQIKSKQSDGFYDVDVVYKKIYYKSGAKAYDSETPESNSPVLAKIFDVVVGSKLTMKLNESGQIKDLKGANELIDKMMNTKTIPDEKVRKRLKTTFNNAFGEKAMRESMEQFFNIYPKKKVKIGQRWSKTVERKAGFPSTNDFTWRLQNVKKRTALVKVKAKINPKPNTKMDLGMALARYNLKGNQEGTIDLDLKSGWVKNAYGKMILNGKMYITIEGQLDEVEVDVKITTISRYKTLN